MATDKIRITVEFGYANSITKEVPAGTTIGQIKADRNLMAALGYGTNVAALVDGVEQGDSIVLEQDDTVTLEVKANKKA